MPVALYCHGPRPRRVPLAGDPFRIGRGQDVELRVDDARAAPLQADIRYRQGEFLLGGNNGEPVFVNGKRVPLIPLQSGDEIHLVDPRLGEATALRFENRMADTFVPPGASRAAAWMAHPGFRDPAYGPGRYGEGESVGGRAMSRCRLVPEPGAARRLLVKVLGPVHTPEHGDQHLGLLCALAGAPHRGLVPMVDGGLSASDEGPVRWSATAWVEGESLRERLAHDGPLEAPRALALLRDLAGGVAHLHARGVIHRDITPANVIETPSGGAVLVDPGHACLAAAAQPLGPGILGTPGYLAPEAVLGGPAPVTRAADVYGLAATGYAMFTGRPPAQGQDVLEALARSAAPPTPLRDLGVELPPPLEAALLEGLAHEPRARPSARLFERSLAFAEATLGLGDAS